jgi:ATP/maltotriose-dependent transcriptional regulator MalT
MPRLQDGSVSFPRTKFHPPATREEHVEHTGLLAKVGRSREQVVVVSGPPGYGKSTFVAQWAVREHDPGRVVWISLDGEDVGARFCAAILTGLADVLGDGIRDALDAVGAPDADLRDAVIVPLLDALAEAEEDVLLVLDASDPPVAAGSSSQRATATPATPKVSPWGSFLRSKSRRPSGQKAHADRQPFWRT